MRAGGKIAVIANHGGDDNQGLLARSTTAWSSLGDRIVGVLAERLDETDGACGAGFLRDIASDRRFPIHLEAPPVGTNCHLDVEGVQAACAQLLAQIPSCDIVVLSKFGKLEASKQGLWAAFSTAAAAGKQVLTTVSPRHVGAWTGFAPAATWLEADIATLENWRQSMRSGT